MNLTSPITVLLLEDDVEDQMLLLRQIRKSRHKFEVDAVETMAEAIRKLQGNRYDVILTDLCVPDSQGMDTVSEIKLRSGDSPIIVLTGLDDDTIAHDILTFGAQDYLVKQELSSPIVCRAIIHAIQRQEMLNHQQALVVQLKHNEDLLRKHAKLLRTKNRRLKKLNQTAQDLVDNISHDFRTPLTVIRDYVNIIGEGLVGEINEKQRSMLDKVSVRADDLNNMVDDLLDISKMQAGLLGTWRRKTRADEIVQRVESMLQQRATSRGVQFVVECDPELPEILCDADKAGRVITNLVVNAIKFSPPNAIVSLRITYQPHKREVVFSVVDHGPGIAADALGQIFERFKRLDNQLKTPIKGFGLGLNIAQQLCRLNLGELEVTSELGSGCTFTFSIPIADSEEVLRRWLRRHAMCNEHLVAIQVEIAEGTSPTTSDEFDHFLNCLLYGDDLLIRVSSSDWIFVMKSDHSESVKWIQRARAELDKANRNRPLGVLPDFDARMIQEWESHTASESILSELEPLLSSPAELAHV